MLRFCLLPLVLFVCGSTAPLCADLIKVADFENGELTALRMQVGSPDAITLVKDPAPVRAGKHAAKILLRASDPQVSKGQRAEFSDNGTKILMDEDYWYGLSLYLPESFTPPQKRDAVLYQWHTQQGGPSPVLAIRVQGNEWVITCNPPGKKRTLKRIPMQKNCWVDWVVHARWASTPTGFLRIWKDGVEVVNEKDIITQYPEALGPYAKFGQYHSVHETPENLIYADEYRVGGSKSSYDEVAPPRSVEKK